MKESLITARRHVHRSFRRVVPLHKVASYSRTSFKNLTKSSSMPVGADVAINDGSTGMRRSTTRRADDVQAHYAQMRIAEATERIHSGVSTASPIRATSARCASG